MEYKLPELLEVDAAEEGGFFRAGGVGTDLPPLPPPPLPLKDGAALRGGGAALRGGGVGCPTDIGRSSDIGCASDIGLNCSEETAVCELGCAASISCIFNRAVSWGCRTRDTRYGKKRGLGGGNASEFVVVWVRCVGAERTMCTSMSPCRTPDLKHNVYSLGRDKA